MSIQEIEQTIRTAPLDDVRRLQRILDERLAGAETAGGDGAQAGSFHDRAKHLIGPPSGVPDLGSNPEHMKGFGRDSLS